MQVDETLKNKSELTTRRDTRRVRVKRKRGVELKLMKGDMVFFLAKDRYRI